MSSVKDTKIAIVHDFLVSDGGAEKVLKAISEIFPDAPIYTLLYDKEKMHGKFEKREIRTSFLQKFPQFLRKRYRWLLPLYPVAVETLDLREFDLVISSSGAWSKGIVTKLKTQHIAYIHSPMRYIWDYNEKYLQDIRKKSRLCARMYLSYLRMWDRLAAERPDVLLANSDYTRNRIQKYYGKSSQVLYPPVQSIQLSSKKETKKNRAKEKHFLIVSRLTESKRIDVAIHAFNKLGLPLKIVGEGPERKHLEKQARNNITFCGWISDEELAREFAETRACIVPQVEDFGMTMVESLQQGVPVIAYREGGACEIIEEGVTGEFFDAQLPGILADGVRRFIRKETVYTQAALQKAGDGYSMKKFQKELTQYIEEYLHKNS